MARCGESSCTHELGVLKGTIIGLNSAINEHQNRMDKIDDIFLDHLKTLKELELRIEKRLDDLEKKQFAIYTIAGIIGAAASIIAKIIF